MRYETPTTTKEAATLLHKEKGQAHILAGGTDLLVRMKMGMTEPTLVVDIKYIPAIQAITKSAAGFKIGATVCGAAMTEHAAKGEVIEAITLPARLPRSGDAYLRFTPRTEMDIAVVSAAVNLTLQRGVVKTARVVLGAVAPTAVIVAKAAKAIIGTKLDDEALEKLAAACSAACNPIDDKRGTIEYRTKVAGVLAKRAAKIAYQRAGGTL